MVEWSRLESPTMVKNADDSYIHSPENHEGLLLLPQQLVSLVNLPLIPSIDTVSYMVICTTGLWTHKLTILMFSITLHIIVIACIVQQAMLCISVLCSTPCLHCITSEFHRDHHVTFLLFSHHHSVYTTYMGQSQSLANELITLDQDWVTFSPPPILHLPFPMIYFQVFHLGCNTGVTVGDFWSHHTCHL